MTTTLEFLQVAQRRGKSREEALTAIEKLKAQGFVFDDEQATEPPTPGTPMELPKPEAPAVSTRVAPGGERITEGVKRSGIERAVFPSEKISFPGSALEPLGTGERLLGAAGERLGVQKAQRSFLGLPQQRKPVEEASLWEPIATKFGPMVEKQVEKLGPRRRAAMGANTGVLGQLFFNKPKETIEAAASFSGDPSVVVSGPSGKLAKIAGKAKVLGTPRKALKGGQGFEFTPAMGAPEKGRLLDKELSHQGSGVLGKFFRKTQDKNIAAMRGQLEKTGKKMGVQPPELLEAGPEGARVAEKIKAIGTGTRKRFRTREEAEIKPSFMETSMDPKVSWEKMYQNQPALKNADDHFNQVDFDVRKYKPGDKIPNTKKVPAKVLKRGIKIRDEIAEAKTIEELLNLRRNVADELFEEFNKGMFQGERGGGWLDGFNEVINAGIEKRIRQTHGDDMAGAFRAINKQYSETWKMVKKVGGILSIGRQSFKSQDVLNKIRLIDTEDLMKLKNAKDPALKAVRNELSRGAYEGLMIQSMGTKSTQVSANKIVTEWAKLKKSGRAGALFPKGVISDMDELVKNVQKTLAKDIKVVSPSQTPHGLLRAKSAAIAKLAADGLKYIGVRHYYRTGKSVPQSVFNVLKGSVEGTGKAGSVLKEFRAMAAANVTLKELFGHTTEEDDRKKGRRAFEL